MSSSSRYLLAAVPALALALSSAGCRGGSARIQGVEPADPGATELLVRLSVSKLWKVQDECRVIAEFAGHTGEAPLIMTPEGPQPEQIAPVIRAWSKGEPSSADRVLVRVMFRNKQLARAQFPPPWDPTLFDGPRAQPRTPAGQPTTSQADLRTPDAAAPTKQRPAGSSSASTDLRTPDAGGPDGRTGSTTSTNPLAPGAPLTPCGTCGEPRGGQTPCPHCGIR